MHNVSLYQYIILEPVAGVLPFIPLITVNAYAWNERQAAFEAFLHTIISMLNEETLINFLKFLHQARIDNLEWSQEHIFEFIQALDDEEYFKKVNRIYEGYKLGNVVDDETDPLAVASFTKRRGLINLHNRFFTSRAIKNLKDMWEFDMNHVRLRQYLVYRDSNGRIQITLLRDCSYTFRPGLKALYWYQFDEKLRLRLRYKVIFLDEHLWKTDFNFND